MEKDKNEKICSVCNNDGSCKNEDIYDCLELWEEKNNIKKGTWMAEWLKNLKLSEQKPRATTGDILRAIEQRIKK